MALKQLTKREYLGEGYLHFFTDAKGNEVVVECTQKEYEALAMPNPVNPTRKGCVWKYSAGGTIKVDTPTTLLGEDEYCIVGEDVQIVLSGKSKEESFVKISKEKVDKDGFVNEIELDKK